jgi:multidrug efflux pump subunit AcrA (membrane-fusion protein)
MVFPLRWRRAAGLCAVLAALAAACDEPEDAAQPRAAAEPLVLPLARLSRGPLQRRVQATGTLFGEEEATISAKVAGRVAAVYRDVGDVLKPGDPLARIESTDYELTLAERRRAFEEALAHLGLEALPDAAFSVDTLPAVERARLQSANAEARYERGRILHQRSPPAISDQDFADIETEWEVAQADHRLAQLTAAAEIAEARTLEAQIATAQQRLDDTLLAVPFGDRPPAASGGAAPAPSAEYAVTARRVSVGDYVQIGAPLFDLLDPDPLKLRVRIPEREIARVRVGQEARLTVEAYAEPFAGRVARINPAVDVSTRTFEVELAVPNGDGRLRAGSFAKVAVETEVEENVALVPRSALSTFAGVHKIFVVEDGKAEERVVTPGQEDGDLLEILRGLEDDDLFATAPPPGLTTGTPVRAAVESAVQ